MQGQRAKDEAVHYETLPVTRGDLVESVNATGTLAPVNEVEIGSEISGTLLAVYVTYNDHVTNGQVLARIDTSKLDAQVSQSQASLESAQAKVLENEATLHEAEAQLARLNQVHERSGGQVPSRNELDAQEASVLRARASIASAKAEVSKAGATLDAAVSDVEKSVIISPINGIVLDRKIEPGQTVAASFEAPVLFTLAEDLTKLELQVDVDEADVGRVKEGQEATFNVDAYPDRNFPATIIQVRYGSTTTDGVVTYTTVLNVSNDDLSLRPGKHLGPGQSSGARPFKMRDAEALEREVPDLAAVSPTMSGSATAIYANENWNTTISAGTEQFFFVNARKLDLGRLFTANEVRSGAAVCVIGETIKEKLFGGADPVGARIRLNRLSCEIVGTLVAKGQSSMGHDQDDLVVIPLRTFQRRMAGNTDISMIQVSMRDGVDSEEVQAEIKRVLRERRHLSATQEDDFDVMDMKEIATMLSGTTKVLTGLLGAVAAVSLLVGGIGIMNIMLVSVTERTREIGTRLAIGALEWEVLLQFLVEAVVLSSFGGLIGITLAMATSLAMTSVLEVPFVFNATIILTSFLFSAAVGVVFGYFPARKAAQLNPIEALRHE